MTDAERQADVARLADLKRQYLQETPVHIAMKATLEEQCAWLYDHGVRVVDAAVRACECATPQFIAVCDKCGKPRTLIMRGEPGRASQEETEG